jgi:hypothetical protein
MKTVNKACVREGQTGERRWKPRPNNTGNRVASEGTLCGDADTAIF